MSEIFFLNEEPFETVLTYLSKGKIQFFEYTKEEISFHPLIITLMNKGMESYGQIR